MSHAPHGMRITEHVLFIKHVIGTEVFLVVVIDVASAREFTVLNGMHKCDLK